MATPDAVRRSTEVTDGAVDDAAAFQDPDLTDYQARLATLRDEKGIARGRPRSRSWARTSRATTARSTASSAHCGEPDGARRANAEFTEYVAPLVEARRSSPGDDLLSAIVTEQVEGQRLADEEVYGFLRLLFPAGVDTTWLTLGILHVAWDAP